MQWHLIKHLNPSSQHRGSVRTRRTGHCNSDVMILVVFKRWVSGSKDMKDFRNFQLREQQIRWKRERMTGTKSPLIIIQSFRGSLMIITLNSSEGCNLMDVSRGSIYFSLKLNNLESKGLRFPCFSNKDQRKLNENIEMSTYYSIIYITTVFIIYLILLLMIILHETYKVQT